MTGLKTLCFQSPSSISFINCRRTFSVYEAKFTPLEEKRPDAMEMATQAHEERKAQALEEIRLIVLLLEQYPRAVIERKDPSEQGEPLEKQIDNLTGNA